MLGKGLKTELKKKMEEDSTGLKAVEFCAGNAKDIVKNISAKFPEGITVRRTALRYRNPNNKPDNTDMKVMNQIIEAKKAKDFKAKPILIETENKYRVYVPLIVDDVCLKCHGDVTKIDKKVHETILKKYPEDKAVGFKLHDLRGVVVAELPKKETKK